VTEHFSAAKAIWDNRERIAQVLPELRELRDTLHDATGGPRDFVRQQWLQLASVVYAFKPDLIIELGRGYGNSTCAMAFGVSLLAPQPCRMLSLCLSTSFAEISRPRLEPRFGSLFQPLTALTCDISGRDFSADLAAARRVFVFWDAHGYELAQDLLGGLFQALQDTPHLSVVHDMADLKYMGLDFRRHDSSDKWMALGSAPPKYVLGDVGAQYEEGIALVDFLSRNGLPFRSAESSYFDELSEDQHCELKAIFGDDFSRYGFWYSFSLNERAEGRVLTFPPRPEPSAAAEPPPARKRGGLLGWLGRS
jgi:hypothetical protein